MQYFCRYGSLGWQHCLSQEVISLPPPLAGRGIARGTRNWTCWPALPPQGSTTYILSLLQKWRPDSCLFLCLSWFWQTAFWQEQRPQCLSTIAMQTGGSAYPPSQPWDAVTSYLVSTQILYISHPYDEHIGNIAVLSIVLLYVGKLLLLLCCVSALLPER